MNRLTEQLTKHADQVRLSSAERLHIQSAVFAAMQPVPSPFNFGTFLMPRLAFTGLALFVFVFTGTAYASQYSLPGDVLYGMKVAVTEPITGSIAFTDSAKVAWHADIAETRLAEAEALTMQGTLTAETSAELADDVRVHQQAIDTIARKIGIENPVSEDRIAASFSNSVATRGNAILVAQKSTKNPIALRASGDLVVRVTGSAPAEDMDVADEAMANLAMESAAPDARMTKEAPMMMAMMAPEPQEEVEVDVSDLAERAREAFEFTSTMLAASTLDEFAMAEAEVRLAKLANLMVKAEAELQLENTEAAIEDFQRVIEEAADIHMQIESASIPDSDETL